jgi:hypothetical protein
MHTIEPVDSRYYLEYTFLPNYFDSLNGNANILTDQEKWHKLNKKKKKKKIKKKIKIKIIIIKKIIKKIIIIIKKQFRDGKKN